MQNKSIRNGSKIYILPITFHRSMHCRASGKCYGKRPPDRPSVCHSVCDVSVHWTNSVDVFANNSMNNSLQSSPQDGKPAAIYHIISYHNINFWGASSKTPAPRPLNKQVSFQ